MANEEINISFVDSEKFVTIGERIMFTAQDFVDAALTFLLSSTEVQTSAEAVQNARRPSPAGAAQRYGTSREPDWSGWYRVPNGGRLLRPPTLQRATAGYAIFPEVLGA